MSNTALERLLQRDRRVVLAALAALVAAGLGYAAIYPPALLSVIGR
jgi:hypothetical protein